FIAACPARTVLTFGRATRADPAGGEPAGSGDHPKVTGLGPAHGGDGRCAGAPGWTGRGVARAPGAPEPGPCCGSAGAHGGGGVPRTSTVHSASAALACPPRA